MKSLRISLRCGLLMMLCSVAAMAQSVQTDYDHSFNLARLKTYEFRRQVRKPDDPLVTNPLNDRRIHDALDSQLKVNGLINSTNAQPDFVITYFVNTHKSFDIQDNRLGLLRRSGGFNVNEVTQGAIIVVFTDNSTGQEVWRGLVSGTINVKDLNRNINNGMTKLVKKFVKDQAGKK
jgi:uncharacterized protein DUF4136